MDYIIQPQVFQAIQAVCSGFTANRLPIGRMKRIELNNTSLMYRSGDTVSGSAYFALDTTENILALDLVFEGVSRVSWTTTSGTGDDKKEHCSTHIVLNETRRLLGDEGHPGSRGTTLGPGEHRYQFSVVLPSSLPSSFTSTDGSVKYSVKLIERNREEFDSVCTSELTVFCPTFLGNFPHHQNPSSRHIEEEISSGCLCCFDSHGFLTITGSVPRTGFKPGDFVNTNVQVENMTTVNVKRITCDLVQSVTYYADGGRINREKKYTETSMLEAELPMLLGSVNPHSSQNFSVTLAIPRQLVPLNLTMCNNIDLKYAVHINAVLSGWHRNKLCEIPIIIATQ